MSKKIVFVCSDQSSKKELELCLEALKAVLRKFRKSANFSFVTLDLSSNFYEASKKKALALKEKYDAILWNLKKDNLRMEQSFIRDCFSCTARQSALGGVSIFSPVFKSYDSTTENEYTKTMVYQTSAIRHCAYLSAEYAQGRTKSVLVCTDTYKKEDSLLYTELENELGGRRNFHTEHYTFDEMIYSLLRRLPICDSILTTDEKADVLKAHLVSMHDYPTAFSVWHSQNVKVYMKDFVAYDEISCCAYASLLLAAAELLINDLSFQSAGAWLRRCTSLTLNDCPSKTVFDFQNRLLYEINTPIRKRQAKEIDSKN